MEPDRSPPARWLLIGNSRWHWAESTPAGLRIWHAPPADPLRFRPEALQGWAASGAVGPGHRLPSRRRLGLAEVPLREAPGWLGIDRALAGWLAWRRTLRPVLVADFGTVLSLTRVDARGRFRGGRLMAGLALQCRAMASGTRELPAVPPMEENFSSEDDPWPRQTRAAMLVGVGWGLAAAVAQAAAAFLEEEGGGRLVLAGGDSTTLGPLVRELLPLGQQLPHHWPDLPLEALVALRPPQP